MRTARFAPAVLAAAMLAVTASGAVAVPTPDGPTRVNQVLVALKQPKKGTAPQTFVLGEADINAFVAVAIQSKKRLGVQKIEARLRQNGGVSAKAQVNMDEVKLEGFTFMVFKALLSGVQTLEADGRLVTGLGKVHYEIDAARFNGMSVPVWLVKSVIAYLSTRQPPNIDVTQPFPLPYGIQDIRVLPGQAVIVR